MKAYLLFGLLFLAACTPEVTHITPQELEAQIDEVFLLDVHVPEQEHITGTDAVIPYNQLEENSDLLPSDKDEKIVVYCRSGSMSKEAAQTLLEMGYRNVENLESGRNGWVDVYG